MNPTDKDINDRLRAIFPDATTASRVVDLVVTNKPKGWARKSCAPYYKKYYAELLSPEIDKMIESRQDIIYRYSKFCDISGGMSHQTLYNRINQSLRFLLDNLDTPDKKYATWYDMVHVTRDRGIGIRISYIPEYRNMGVSEFRADVIQPKEDAPKWKQKMEDWLEGSDMTPLFISGLCLTEHQVEQLRIDMKELTNVAASIDSGNIKIIRMS